MEAALESRWKHLSFRIIAVVALSVSIVATEPAVLAQDNTHWVGTWTTALVPRAPLPLRGQGRAAPAPPAQGQQGQASPARRAQARPPLNFNNQTLRQIVRTSLGGTRVRVVLSNTFGTAPLAVGGASVAVRAQGSAIVPNSTRELTFDGSSSATIAAGGVLFSDPVNLTVDALSDLVVDMYLPQDTASGRSPLSTHRGALQTNYVSPLGNHVGTTEMPVQTTSAAWFFLSRVEVVAPAEVGAVVTLGDSITNGSRATVDTNNRWPDHLARRLNAPASLTRMGVLNVGIGGNRILTGNNGTSALARFDRDVLAQTGATHLVILEGINDIGGRDASAAEVIAGHKQLIERARARGLKVYGGTLTPFEGTSFAGYWTPEHEAARQAVNQWIRTSNAYDVVIDFDAPVRDPSQPTRILPQWDAGDHIHPNDAGYEAMGNAVDLKIFETEQLATSTK